MKCQGQKLDTMAYFTNCERKPVHCEDDAEWRVFVNPPNDKSDK